VYGRSTKEVLFYDAELCNTSDQKNCQKVKLLTVLSKAATVVGNTTTVAFYKIAIKTVEIINTITMDSVFEAATQPANRIQVLL
jgi:hypothetical protein